MLPRAISEAKRDKFVSTKINNADYLWPDAPFRSSPPQSCQQICAAKPYIFDNQTVIFQLVHIRSLNTKAPTLSSASKISIPTSTQARTPRITLRTEKGQEQQQLRQHYQPHQ